MGGTKTQIDCACHTNPHTPCSIPGGCGSAGCDHSRRTGNCTTCPVLRPDTAPRQPHRPAVCDGDRRLLDRWLGEIAGLVADLSQPEQPVLDDRRYERWIRDHQGHPRSLGETWADPLTAVGGVAPINSPSKQPRTTGSRERPIPVNATALDLTASARVHHLTGHAWPEDQIGHLSAATVLDAWIRDVRDQLLPDHHLPGGTVDDMVGWLRNRIDLVCDRHPQVAEFAEALRMLRGALRSAAGQSEPQPERCEGVPCRRCDMMMLYRHPGSDVVCANPDCQAVLRDDEYRDWVKTVAAETRAKQHQHA